MIVCFYCPLISSVLVYSSIFFIFFILSIDWLNLFFFLGSDIVCHDPSNHRHHGRFNRGFDLRIRGRRSYNPEGHNRLHQSVCELPCYRLTLTILNDIYILYTITDNVTPYYSSDNCRVQLYDHSIFKGLHTN